MVFLLIGLHCEIMVWEIGISEIVERWHAIDKYTKCHLQMILYVWYQHVKVKSNRFNDKL